MRYLLIFLAAILSYSACGQAIEYGAGIIYTNGAPTHNPGATGSRRAIDITNNREYSHSIGTTWFFPGHPIRPSGSNFTPGTAPLYGESSVIINNLYDLYYWNDTSWVLINGGGNGVYGGSDTIPTNTLATVTFDPEGDAADFAIGTFPNWPSVDLDGTEKGLYFAENLYGEIGLIYEDQYVGVSGQNAVMVSEGKRISVEPDRIRFNFGPSLMTGSGDPEGILAARTGSFYLNTAGGAGVSMYLKESGADGNTGWVPIGAVGGGGGNGIYGGSGLIADTVYAQLPNNGIIGFGQFADITDPFDLPSNIGIQIDEPNRNINMTVGGFNSGTYFQMADNYIELYNTNADGDPGLIMSPSGTVSIGAGTGDFLYIGDINDVVRINTRYNLANAIPIITNGLKQTMVWTGNGVSSDVAFETIADQSATNELQTLASTSNATSHTVTLSNSGGSIQFVEGTNVTLSTSGTGLDGIVTISAAGGVGSDGNGIYSGSGLIQDTVLASMEADGIFGVGTFANVAAPLASAGNMGMVIDETLNTMYTTVGGTNGIVTQMTGQYYQIVNYATAGSSQVHLLTGGNIDILAGLNDKIDVGDSDDTIRINAKYKLANATPISTSGVKSVMTWTGNGSAADVRFDTLDQYTTPISFVFDWRSAAYSIGSTPGAGYAAVNNANPALATHVVVSKLTNDSVDISNLFYQLREGDVIRIQDKDNNANWLRYDVDSVAALQGSTHFSILVTPATNQGIEPGNDQEVTMSMFLAGAAAAGGDGIYGGSGAIAPNAVATLTNNSTFTIRYPTTGNQALYIDDQVEDVHLYTESQDGGLRLTDTVSRLNGPVVALLGKVRVESLLGDGGEIRLQEPSAGGISYTALKAGAQSTNLIYTMPLTNGLDGQILTFTTGGQLVWDDVPGGGPAGANYQVQYYDDGMFGAESSFNYSPSQNRLVVGSDTARAAIHGRVTTGQTSVAALFETAGGSDIMSVNSNGAWKFGNNETYPYFLQTATTGGAVTFTGNGISAFTTFSGTGNEDAFGVFNPTSSPTAGTKSSLRVNNSFAPSSGTAQSIALHVTPTINQTGGANGQTWGLYINPTITAASNFTAAEIVGTTKTNHLQGRGTAPTVTVDAFAGTGATATVSGTDLGFVVTLNTGTSPGTMGGKLFTINYSTAMPGVSIPVFSAGDDGGAFAFRSLTSPCYVANADNTDFELWTTEGMTASTTYKINFIVVSK